MISRNTSEHENEIATLGVGTTDNERSNVSYADFSIRQRVGFTEAQATEIHEKEKRRADENQENISFVVEGRLARGS